MSKKIRPSLKLVEDVAEEYKKLPESGKNYINGYIMGLAAGRYLAESEQTKTEQRAG